MFKNRTRQKEYLHQWYLKNKARLARAAKIRRVSFDYAAWRRAYYKAHKTAILASNRRWNTRNRDKLLAARKRYQKTPKMRAWHKQWLKKRRKTHPHTFRRYDRNKLLRKYGLTEAAFQALKKAQGNRCAICKKRVKRLCVDHDHKTKRNRALLCVACNVLVGYCEHPRLPEGLNYLENYKGYVDEMNKEAK